MNIPTLETERMVMREWRESDFENYAELRCDPVAAKWIGGVMDRNDAWRSMVYFIGHWSVRGYGCWSLEHKQSGQAIGYCGPYYPMGWPEPEIAWGIHPRFQNQGFATEAAAAALLYAYTTLQWTTAISLIADENLPSQALARKLGAASETSIIYRETPCTVFRHLSPTDFQTHSKEKLQCH